MADIVPIAKHREYYRQTKRSAAGVLVSVRALKPTEVLCICYDADGELFVQGSPPDPANAMWLMEQAKQRLLYPNG
jgi:hypothetical protein